MINKKRNKLNELRLAVEPHNLSYTDVTKGMKGVDSMFSSISNTENFENYESSEEDEMDDLDYLVLESRRRKSVLYTADLNNENLNEDILRGIGRIAKAVVKAGITSIPYVDAFAAAAFIADSCLKIKEGTEAFHQSVGKKIFTAKMFDSQKAFEANLNYLNGLDEERKKLAYAGMNEILEGIKFLIIDIITGCDSFLTTPVAAGAGAVSGGVAGLLALGGVNIGTGFIGFIAAVAPVEQFFAELIGKFAQAFNGIMRIILGAFGSSEELAKDEKSQGFLSKIKKTLSNPNNPLVAKMLLSPISTIARLMDTYEILGALDDSSLEATYNKYKFLDPESAFHDKHRTKDLADAIKNKDQAGLDSAFYADEEDPFLQQVKQIAEAKRTRKLIHLFEEKNEEAEQFDEIDLEKIDELEEISGATAIAIGTAPLGKKGDGSTETASQRKSRIKAADIYSEQIKLKEKQINEQRERIALLQTFHQKTTNRLK